MRTSLDVKLWLYSTVAMFVLVSLLAYLGKFISPQTGATSAEVTTMMRVWLYVGRLIFCIMFVYIYTRGYESKPALAQGLRYGIWMVLLVPVPLFFLAQVTSTTFATDLMGFIVSNAIPIILSGLLVGQLYRPKQV
jgi:hypothetical protein